MSSEQLLGFCISESYYHFDFLNCFGVWGIFLVLLVVVLQKTGCGLLFNNCFCERMTLI